MKIEAGNYYRTRDGQKAYVGHILPEEIARGNHYLVRGYLLKESGLFQESWRIDGRFSVPEPNHRFDLVAEWTEPKKYRATFGFDEKGDLSAFDVDEIISDKNEVVSHNKVSECTSFRKVVKTIELNVSAND